MAQVTEASKTIVPHFPQIKEGEWVEPIREGYRMACCDCGLVHVVNFKLVKGKIRFQAFRDTRATAMIRRGVKHDLRR